MAYNLLLALIRGNRKPKKELVKKANVFYVAGQLTDEQYTEIMAKLE